jgi:hypothetical protein
MKQGLSMSIDEKALEAGYEAVKDEWTYLPVERADWLRAITAAITAYEAAKAPEQADIKAGPAWAMLESGTYIWDAEKKTLTQNVASADATATVSVGVAEQPDEIPVRQWKGSLDERDRGPKRESAQPDECRAAFMVAMTAYQQVDGDVNPKALKAALSAYSYTKSPVRESGAHPDDFTELDGILCKANCHVERIAELEAQLKREAFGWQPLSTAPKDGTAIIIARIESGKVWHIRMAAWAKIGWYEIYSGAGVNYPTHWMPLPVTTHVEDGAAK